MKQVIIENPIINSAFSEPTQHFRFDDEGITSNIVKSHRISHYFIPIAKPKKKGKSTQLELNLGGEWTSDRVEENKFINSVRDRVSLWRQGGHLGVTPTTRRLLEYWTNPERERLLYFCQIEALETVIYITEVAKKYGDNWIENQLRQFNTDALRYCFVWLTRWRLVAAKRLCAISKSIRNSDRSSQSNPISCQTLLPPSSSLVLRLIFVISQMAKL